MFRCIICCILLVVNYGAEAKLIQELSDFNITQIIQILGYPVQIHEVVTDDGYLLDIYRIPHGRNKDAANPNPVLLHHGLLGTAEQFVWMGPNRSLAFLLADGGYDVWLMNDRGTIHSRKHMTMDPDADKQFWSFTFHEIGIYDVPATIDYILNVTNKASLHYVGHSQGVATALVMASELPEYNTKIKVLIALAPAASFRYMPASIIQTILPYYKRIVAMADMMQMYEIPPSALRPLLLRILKSSCASDRREGSLCEYALNFGGEEDPGQFDETLLPLILPNMIAGGSFKQFAQFAQIIHTGQFGAYDWGPSENQRRYNSTAAPLYNLKRVKFPIAFFVGENDAMVGVKDVIYIAKKLPNVVEFYRVPLKQFTHLDFLWSKDIYPLLNKRIMEVMNMYIDS